MWMYVICMAIIVELALHRPDPVHAFCCLSTITTQIIKGERLKEAQMYEHEEDQCRM